MRPPLAAALVSALFLFGCPKKADPGWITPPADGIEVRCPVSNEVCSKTPQTEAAVVDERTYYFCCEGCRDRFAKDPKAFLR